MQKILELCNRNELRWVILQVECVTKPDADTYYDKLTLFVDDIFGYAVEWNKLLRIIEGIEQIYTICIVGTDEICCKKFNMYSSNRLMEECEVIIEAPDSPDWEIFIQNPKTKEKFIKFINETIHNNT